MEKGCPSQPKDLGEPRKLPSRVRVRAQADRKRVLMYLELEKTQLMVTNLTFLTFLRHLFIFTFTITMHKTSCI